jgi:branched-subunit amino acid transport protein
MWRKYCRAWQGRGGPQRTIWRMRIEYWIRKPTNTHWECVTHIDFQGHNGRTNGPNCYIARTLPILLTLYCNMPTSVKQFLPFRYFDPKIFYKFLKIFCAFSMPTQLFCIVGPNICSFNDSHQALTLQTPSTDGRPASPRSSGCEQPVHSFENELFLFILTMSCHFTSKCTLWKL